LLVLATEFFLYTRYKKTKLKQETCFMPRRGMREVLRRVDEDGIAAHRQLSSIFTAASSLSADDRRDASAVYDVLYDVPRPRDPVPRYAF
jgi:hypothetical protein